MLGAAILTGLLCMETMRYTPGVEFPSLERAEKALRSVAPELEDSTFSVRDGACEASIVFAEAMELDDAQPSALGIKVGPGQRGQP